MRFRTAALLAVALLLALTTPALAATASQPPHKVPLKSGGEAEIRAEPYGTGLRVRITVPSGVTITRTDHGGGSSSWGGPLEATNADYDLAYEAYDTWRDDRPQPKRRSIPIFAALLVGGLGALNLFKPRLGWYLSEGWKFRDAEPSDLALFLGQAVGFIAMVAGIIMLFAG